MLLKKRERLNLWLKALAADILKHIIVIDTFLYNLQHILKIRFWLFFFFDFIKMSVFHQYFSFYFVLNFNFFVINGNSDDEIFYLTWSNCTESKLVYFMYLLFLNSIFLQFLIGFFDRTRKLFAENSMWAKWTQV